MNTNTTTPARKSTKVTREEPMLQAKFQKLRDAVSAVLVERDQEVEGALTALLSGHHFLMVGAPGTAKSLLCDSLLHGIRGASKFDILLMKTTTPEDVFGPIDVPAMVAGTYRRNVEGFLPSTQIAFLDEIWKAGPAILNSLLKVLNERKYRNGTEVIDCPLLVALAASNEYPNEQEGGKELGAMFDRFLIRMSPRQVATTEGTKRLLWDRSTGDLKASGIGGILTLDEVREARERVSLLEWTPEAMSALEEVLRVLRKDEGVEPGDRRKRHSVNVCRAYAWLNGRTQVTPEDLEILRHVLWSDPAEQPAKVAKVIARVANPAGMQVTDLLQQINDAVSTVGEGAAFKLTDLVTCIAKLDDIKKRLQAIRHPRAAKAVAHCEAKIKAGKLKIMGG